MTRKFRLQNQLVFEPSIPRFARKLVSLLLVGCGAGLTYLVFVSLTGALQIIVSIVVAILAILLFVAALDGIEGKVIVDAEGIEWQSPINKTRLLWSDGLQFGVRYSYTRGGYIKIYDVMSANGKISFGENLRNHAYLRILIDTGINGIADENNELNLPLPPLDESKDVATNAMFLVSLLSFIGAVLVGLMLYQDAEILYLTPTVPIKDVAKYADKYVDIKVKGNLHAEPPVVSRDQKHDYSYQFVRLNLPPEEGTGVIFPFDLYLTEGPDKLRIKVSENPPNYFGESLRTPFKKNWQNSDVGKLTNETVDDHFKEFDNTPPSKDLEITVLNINQDQPVESIGHVKTQDGEFVLTAADGASFWLMPSPNKEIEQNFLIKAIIFTASLALGIYLLIACYLEIKNKEVN